MKLKPVFVKNKFLVGASGGSVSCLEQAIPVDNLTSLPKKKPQAKNMLDNFFTTMVTEGGERKEAMSPKLWSVYNPFGVSISDIYPLCVVAVFC